MTRSRLTRSSLDRVLGGVCGGIGTYLGISAWWVRVALLALCLTIPNFGVLLYILLWLIMPSQTLADVQPVGVDQPRLPRPESTLMLGAGVIIIGVTALAYNLNILTSFKGELLTPVMLFLIGLALLSRQLRRA